MNPMGPSIDMRFWKGKILIWVHQTTWAFWVHQSTWGGEKLGKIWLGPSKDMSAEKRVYYDFMMFGDYTVTTPCSSN